MAGQPSTSIQLPPPPPDRARGARWICGAFVLASGAFAVTEASITLGACSALFAGFGYLLVVGRQKEVGGHLAMAALDRAARGRFDEARSMLDAVSPRVLGSFVGQMVDSQRAALALYEGDLEASVAFATSGAREGRRLFAHGRIHRGSALSLRAVALAALGRKEECLADVAKVRTADFRQGSFLARAALAEAILFAREKDLDSLANVLREERALLFGATSMRERMVARALARMVAAKKVSVYREAAKRDEDELSENDSWVARIAPEAASYARAPALGTRLGAPERVNPTVLAQAERLPPDTRARRWRLLGLWVLLIVVFLVLWKALGRMEPGSVAGPAASGEGGGLTLLGAVGVVLLGVLWLGVKVVRARKADVALQVAMEQRVRGQHEAARGPLEKLARSKVEIVRPQAERELAALATAEGEFRLAQTRAAEGIMAARVTRAIHELSRPILLPQLHGELAVAFAAQGKVARAEEEIDKLRFFPSYPFLARDTFRARVIGATAAGDLENAAELARSRPIDLPLSMNEELLCDALRVHAGDSLPHGERERILLELREAPPGKFLDRVAPTLRTAAPTAQLRIAVATAAPEIEDEEPLPPRARSRSLPH